MHPLVRMMFACTIVPSKSTACFWALGFVCELMISAFRGMQKFATSCHQESQTLRLLLRVSWRLIT